MNKFLDKKMINRFFILFVLFLLVQSNGFSADDVPQGKPQQSLAVEIKGEDTVYLAFLHDLYIFPVNSLYKTKAQEKYFWKTVRDVKRTLPYARIVSAELFAVNERLATIKTKKERNKYISEYQKEIFKKYENDLRRMTVSQGKMLIKLIDRECDKTSYDLIKMYKGSFTAFFWQGIAKIFGANLKSEYDAQENDKILERIILLVEAGQL
jgi:hypothetical protein